jgi:outer membrane PBP1 activator LpoA protein
MWASLAAAGMLSGPYAGHAESVAGTNSVNPGPARIALLLPLSGKDRVVAEAIRDGFLAAHFASATSGGTEIIIVDEERPTPLDAYRSVNAAFVVGPLLRSSLSQIAAASGSQPLLALNYLDGSGPAPAAMFQFSLSPEDEALAVAEQAVSRGERRALVFAPDNEFGRRMLAAFSAAYQGLGGIVAGQRTYSPGGTNFTSPISALLQLDASASRHRSLVANLGVPLEFEPARRTDADCIFLVANPEAGRLIRPQLRFLYAGDLPTYSTSAIHQSGGNEQDLDGVQFVDSPVIISPDANGAELRKALEKRWPPSAGSRLRFYAFGFDAYHLARHLAAGELTDMPGLTGLLQIDPQRRVHRKLGWAEIRDGRAVFIDRPSATSTPPAQ